jgi:hypothetical protein
MNTLSASRPISVLLVGDIATLAIVTLFGFASHGSASSAGGRMLTTFLPLVAAWLLVAPHLGVFDQERAADPRQLWRPVWAMILASPLAAWLRGVWLGTDIQPVFVVVLGGVSCLALLAWRALFWITAARK